jgi:RNA-directed DNA polymerase
MNSSRYNKYQTKELCKTLGCKIEELKSITDNIDSFYEEIITNKINKETGDKKCFRDGTIKKRILRPSIGRLKELQKIIKVKILDPIKLPDNVHGGIKKKSNITNAKVHQGKKYQFTTDLLNFYPGINNLLVYNVFLSLGFSNHKAHWLTKLTTWKYELPQGTPTSPHLANLVFLDTDYKIISLCKKHNITYTRFVDDLSLSSQKDFHSVIKEILEIITTAGFKINNRKTKYKGNQTITGINVFNNYIDASETIKSKLKKEKILNPKVKPISNYVKNIRITNKK